MSQKIGNPKTLIFCYSPNYGAMSHFDQLEISIENIFPGKIYSSMKQLKENDYLLSF